MSTADQVQNLFDTMSQHLDAEKAAGLAAKGPLFSKD